METEEGVPELVGLFIPTFGSNEPGTVQEGGGEGEDEEEEEEEEGGEDPLNSVRRLFQENRRDGGNLLVAPAALSAPRLDHRYYVVKGLRQKDNQERELNQEVGTAANAAPSSAGFMVPGDDRTC